MGCLWCGKYSRQCKTMPSGPPEFIPPFIPVTRMKCSYGKISSQLTEISGTEPAHPLIWTHQKFYKGFRSEARSWKLGSYEEAFKVMSKRPVPDRPNRANPRLKCLIHKLYEILYLLSCRLSKVSFSVIINEYLHKAWIEYLSSRVHSWTRKTLLLKICLTLGLTGTPFEERACNPCPGTYNYNEQIQPCVLY